MKKIVFLFFLFCVNVLSAQNWRVYNTSNSLSPSNTYYTMAIDTANNKWFTVFKGNPYGDTTICFGSANPWNMRYNSYTSTLFNCIRLKIDYSNIVWQCTYNGEAYSLIGGISSAWHQYNVSNTGLWAMSSIWDMCVDKNNYKWFACGGDGLVKYDNSSVTLIDTANSDLSFEPIFRISAGKNGDVWIFGSIKFAKYNGSNWQLMPALPFTMSTSDRYSIRIVTDSIDNVWLCRGSPGDGLYKFDGSSWTNYNTGNSSIPSDSVTAVAIDKNNEVWISYYKNDTAGLAHFDGATWTNYDSVAGYPCSKSSNELQVDRYNNKWLIPANCGAVVFNETGVVNTGMDEIGKEDDLSLYPNPADNNLTLEFEDQTSNDVLIVVKNVLGQTLYSEEMKNVIGKQSKNIDVSAFSNGVYLVQLNIRGKIASKKFIKE